MVLPHSIIIQLYTINTYAISVCDSGGLGLRLRLMAVVIAVVVLNCSGRDIVVDQ